MGKPAAEESVEAVEDRATGSRATAAKWVAEALATAEGLTDLARTAAGGWVAVRMAEAYLAAGTRAAVHSVAAIPAAAVLTVVRPEVMADSRAGAWGA